MAQAGQTGYIAAVLDEASKALLEKLATHKNVYCTHVTMAYSTPLDEWGPYEALLGTEVELTCVGIAKDHKGQAVLIEGVISENSNPHITISIADGNTPGYGKLLIRRTPRANLKRFNQKLKATVTLVPFPTPDPCS